MRANANVVPYELEHILLKADYDNILKILENMALVMERCPSAFSSLKEEDLRMHFLVQLNGLFAGNATGETFNYSGKTDILIRVGGRNIFIGECKFWAGPRKFAETIDQLLGYSSWRDTKTALLIFNKKKNFTRVLKEISSTIKRHPNLKRILGRRSETSFQYVFRHKNDNNRELLMTVLAFDVPYEEQSKRRGCYIATAVYGDYDAPQVLTLRRFRDEVLMKSKAGQIFVAYYYKYSPRLAEKLKDQKRINRFVRFILDGVVGFIEKIKNYDSHKERDTI
jgi:hypothetical protein